MARQDSELTIRLNKLNLSELAVLLAFVNFATPVLGEPDEGDEAEPDDATSPRGGPRPS